MIVLALAAPLLLIAAGCWKLVGLRHARRADNSRWPRRLAFAAPTALAGAFALLVFGTKVEFLLDLPWLYAVQRNAKPVLEALERHGAERGGPPSDLEALVPHYLPKVPGTGWFAYPRFELGDHEGGEGLYVECGRVLSFDQYFHAPRHLAVEDSGMTTRIGDWVYYHE